jgi:hypothetical protein
MKPILQKNIPALSGKSRGERNAIVVPLLEIDSKLKFYRKIFVGIIIFSPAYITAFYGSRGTLTAAFFTGAFIAVTTSTFLQLFYFNPRLKEILGDKSA